MKLRLFQIDAFASELFAGNPAAVVPLEQWLPDPLLQKIAIENNLSETAFFIPETAECADFHLRWFTPGLEVKLCGHATMATGFALRTHLGWGADAVAFRSRSGPLRVTFEGEQVTLDFPAMVGEAGPAPDELSEALGRRPIEVLRARGGDDHIVAVFESAEEVRAIRPDLRAIRMIGDGCVAVTAPGEDCDFVSRFFAPGAGINEDPVTGSLHCTLTPYWSTRLDKGVLNARQLSARGGELICELRGDRVLIGGRCVTYLVGEIEVPETI